MHPEIAWAGDGELRSLEHIQESEFGDESKVTIHDRAMLVAEAAGMKLDAPLETTGTDRSLHLLVGCANDIIPARIRTSDFGRVVDRPYWQSLASVGGAASELLALPCGDTDSPGAARSRSVGWFGWSHVSVRWLVTKTHTYSNDTLANLAQFGGNYALASLGQTRWPSTRYADVAVQRMDQWRAEFGLVSDVEPPLAAPWISAPAGVREPLVLASALGRRWVRVELTKVVTAYRILQRINRMPDADCPSLPRMEEALERLALLRTALEELHGTEKRGRHIESPCEHAAQGVG